MKFAIPEISWHNRDPVLSVDFQPKAEANEPLRLATGGTDSHVLIWYLSTSDTGAVNLEVAADLTRHQKAVNVVRWAPNGQYLASGDDESIIFIWKKTDKEPAPALEQMEEQYKESWVIYKTLRGHMEDVLDISWSANSLHLASGSVDNKLLVWDLARGRYSSILTDHKGFVQGVSWDPKGQLIASASTDRVFRTFDISTKKVTSRSSKAILPFPAEHPFHDIKVRLYHDDTLQTYYRRLQFSPDGMLIAVPAGRVEPEQGKMDTKPINAVYIYTRYSLKVPACILPTGEPALVARWNPRLFVPRSGAAALPLRHRMVLALGTRRSVLLYDTQQKTPLALVNNIHYTRLTDLTWSPDGLTLVASSTDGFCSVISFAPGELGDLLPDVEPGPDPMEVETQEPDTPEEKPQTETNETATVTTEPKDTDTKKETKDKPARKDRKATKPVKTIDSFIKFKAPVEKSKEQKESQQKTPVKMDCLEEVAMPSWSDNSNNDIIKHRESSKDEIMIIEDSEDMKLVYEETQGTQSPKEDKTETEQSPKNDKLKESPKRSPKLINFGTPSSKNSDQPSTPKGITKGDNNFLRQAKVTDVKEPVGEKAAPSPKAPRRVSFVTLSSPKNTKKK